MLTAWGAVRFFAALRFWDVLSEFDSSLSPFYLSMTGAGWGVAGCVLLSGILRKKAWTLPAFIASIMVWLLEYWLERIFFQAPRSNLPFALTCSILVIAVAWILTLLPRTRLYFARSEEHEQPVEKPNTA